MSLVQSMPAQGEGLTTPRPNLVRPQARDAGSEVPDRVGPRHVHLLTRQLCALLKAGLPLAAALAALQEQLGQSGSASLQQTSRLVARLRDQVTGGQAFSAALSRHGEIFPPVYVSMVAAGELGGTLEQALHRLADMWGHRIRLAGQVKAALAYPLIMGLVAAAVVLFLLAYVVPGITQIFLELNRPLPWPTRALIAVSAAVRGYLWVMVVVGLGTVVGLKAWAQGPKGRDFLDRAYLRLPAIRGLILKTETARLTRTLGALMGAGVPLPRSLDVTAGVIRNTVLRGAWQRVAVGIQQGQPMARAVRATGVFEPMVCHILATGQQTGTLEQGLADIAQMYDQEIENQTKTLAALVEPVILLVMGGLVGFIVMAILLPIFEINQTL